MSEELYLNADRKIEKLKDEVSDLIKSDMGLGAKIDVVLTEQRLLKERFEEGVSRTVASTAAKVNDLVALVSAFKSEHENLAYSFRVLKEDVVEPVVDNQKWMIRGLLAVVFLSVFASVMSFLWKFRG